MKLAIALVAALSLAACVDEPTDPGASLSGIGPSKSFTTDPNQLISKDFDPRPDWNGQDVSDLNQMLDQAIEIADIDTCITDRCAAIALRMSEVDVLYYNSNGKYLGHGDLSKK